MSQTEKFEALNNMLDAFIKSTDAMKAAVDTTPEAVLMPCQWQKCPEIEETITAFKSHSDALSGSCTKLSLVDLASMPAEGLQSLFDEILQIAHGLISAVMVLFGLKLSRPLFDDIHKLAKAELTQVHGLVVSIHTGRFETCMASIGQVWEMNGAIQKIPLTNKVAYKRALMGVLSVIKDTHREFKEARDESAEINKGKNLEEGLDEGGDDDQGDVSGNKMDENWGVMMGEEDDDDGFSPEEMPYVDASLSIMEKAFTFIKVTMDVMSLLSEQPTPSTGVFTTVETSAQFDVQVWVANVFNLSRQLSPFVTDLGMELYAPLSLTTLKVQYDAVYAGVSQLQEQLVRAHTDCTEKNSLNEDCDLKMKKLLKGTEDLMTQIDLEKLCFASI